MRIHCTPAVLIVALVSAACSSSPSPTSPSRQAAGSATGAVISGSVRSGSPLLASTTGAVVQGLLVSVPGTSISSGVDAAGLFSLTGVPAGDVELHFSGPGVNTTVRVSQVRTNETVSLRINLDGGAAVVEAQARSTASEEQVEGRIESVPPTMPAGTARVAGRTVRTDSATRVEQGGTPKTFADLQIGMRVHVTGTPSGGDVLATVIRIQNTHAWIPVPVNGVIDSFSGSDALFQFKIGSRLIKGDNLTEFFGGSRFSMLSDGDRVEVKGQQRDGYIYAERIHISGDEEDEDDEEEDDEEQDQSASIHGVLTAISGSRPALTLVVGGVTVRTSANTVVQRRGDTQTLEALQLGQDLHVVGDRRTDGSLEARRIQIRDDQTGGVVEIEGSVGGLKGTCPALSFGVNGFQVVTSGATTFAGGACSALKSGNKVKVTGTRQADGSILAVSVTQ